MSGDRPPRGTPPRHRPGHGKSPSWMITFVDLVSLLLAFFVMMYSMTTPNAPRWQEFTAAMRSVFVSTNTREPPKPNAETALQPERARRGLDVGYLRRVLEETLARAPDLRTALLRERGGFLILSLPSDAFFATGAAEVTDRGRRALFELALTLSNIKNRVDVVGHTDPRPLTGTGAFSSKWELSLARAAAVADTLRESGYRRGPVAEGVADTRYADIDIGLPEAERMRMARRVDLMFRPDQARQ